MNSSSPVPVKPNSRSGQQVLEDEQRRAGRVILQHLQDAGVLTPETRKLILDQLGDLTRTAICLLGEAAHAHLE
jgi:uncharacterized protein Smg (DUF494 family)